MIHGASGDARRHEGRSLAFAAAMALAAIGTATSAEQGGVATTVHNLSASGPGEIRAVNETEVCKFCHIPHNAVVSEPLWSRRLSSAIYEMPEADSSPGASYSVPGQPDGASRLCLSCHDGTIALGEIAGNRNPVVMAGADRLAPTPGGFQGTDLSGGHPISFVLRDSGNLSGAEGDMGLRSLPAIRSDPDVRLDSEGKMQCTSCHDPHSDRFYAPGKVPRFWVKPTVAEVCLTCHEPR